MRFQDGAPVHWLTLESIVELSENAGENIPWQRFRPQIVVEGVPAQYEHGVGTGRFGLVDFENEKPCDRCLVTTLDQETGEKRGKEPLATLATYKKWRDSDGGMNVIFGENVLPLGMGTITVGDPVIKLTDRTPELVYGAEV